MSFLAPLLLAGLAAVAIPIVLHLVQRERKRLIEFPSLMFLRKIPYQSVRRRAIRHWPLLLLRVLVIALLAVAFARPFFRQAGAAALAAGGGRDVVVLLDTSASMGYGDHWQRAQAAARDAVRALGPADRGTIAFFSTGVEIGPRASADPATLLAAIDRAAPGAGATRYAPALRAAAGLLETASLARREVVVISDFQKVGWDAGEDVAMPRGTVVTPVPVTTAAPVDAAIAGLTLERERADDREMVRAAARVVNRGAETLSDREVALEVDGRRVDSRRVSVEPGAAAAVQFTPFALPSNGARVTVRLGEDQLAADNVFHAVIPAADRIPVLLVESPNPEPDASLYLARALDVGRVPAFTVTITRADRVSGADLRRAAVVVLNDAAVSEATARAFDGAVRGGVGLLVALGERSAWPAETDLLPGTPGAPIDRAGTRGGTLGYTDLAHPAFEIFSTPRSGDLTAARIFRYRQLTLPTGWDRGSGKPPASGPDTQAQPSPERAVVARFDDGAVALAERRAGQGRVLVWTSTFDSYWNDFALKPVFVPFVHQVMKHLSGYIEPRPWYLAGEVYETARHRIPGVDATAAPGATFLAVAPGGRQETLEASDRPLVVPLSEQGFYEIRAAGAAADGAATRPASVAVAVNVDPAESDLSPLDPAELAGSVQGGGAASAAAIAEPELTLEERERRQSLWWYVLVASLLVFVVELVYANRLPRAA